MPRIRTIKPELWQDEKLAALDPLTRLVFVGLISMADDAGRLVDNVKSIDGFIFPETEDTSRDSLGILARLSRILRYTAPNGQKIIQIVNWERHQKVDHPNKYVLPPPEPEAVAAAKDAQVSVETRESVARISRNPLATTSTSTPISTLPPDGGKPSGGWTGEFTRMYEPIGIIAPGQIGRHLKPVVDRYGLDRTREMWGYYIRHAPHMKFGRLDPDSRDTSRMSPADFAKNAGTWYAKTQPVGGPDAATAS